MDNYRLLDLFSCSQKSKIYKAEVINKDQKVVIKIIRSNENTSSGIKREIKALRNLLILLNILPEGIIETERVCIITEYISNGKTLYEYARQNVDLNSIIDIMKGIVKGLKFIHNNGYIHFDIKPQNIIIDENNNPKIIDFDLSQKRNNVKSKAGTPYYMAPEIWTKQQLDDYRPCDIYSLGVTYYFLINKTKLPYNGTDLNDLENNVLRTAPRASSSGYEILDALVMSMIDKKIKNRPSLKDILSSLS